MRLSRACGTSERRFDPRMALLCTHACTRVATARAAVVPSPASCASSPSSPPPHHQSQAACHAQRSCLPGPCTFGLSLQDVADQPVLVLLLLASCCRCPRAINNCGGMCLVPVDRRGKSCFSAQLPLFKRGRSQPGCPQHCIAQLHSYCTSVIPGTHTDLITSATTTPLRLAAPTCACPREARDRHCAATATTL
jgi:hypothetical protein